MYASRSLNLITGGAISLAYCQPVKLLALVLAATSGPVPSCSRPPPESGPPCSPFPCCSYMRQARSRNVLQGVLLRAVDRHVVVAAHAGVHKFDVDVVADSLKIAVMPYLEGIGRGISAALFHRAARSCRRWDASRCCRACRRRYRCGRDPSSSPACPRQNARSHKRCAR